MHFTDETGNKMRLVWKWRRVRLMRLNTDTGFWCNDGFGSGVLVELTCWHGEVWYVRPERELRWRRELPYPHNQHRESLPNARLSGRQQP